MVNFLGDIVNCVLICNNWVIGFGVDFIDVYLNVM